MLKLNRLLYSTIDSDLFINRIKPTPAQRKVLVDAKNEIRDYLKPLVRAATTKELGMDHPVTPRFRTQGSWAYDTCVQPCSTPPQEMDWDFGMYLPFTVWHDNGPPAAMAKAYFDLVERLLVDLCKKRGWHLNGEKNQCIRIHISDTAHIDMPLYAVPEQEFETIVERAALLKASMEAHGSLTFDAKAYADSQPKQTWDELTDISMATRAGEWWKSDPQEVSAWFDERLMEFKDQLLRVCRYLKAWRDFHWKTGGPTSVLIMIIVARAFERFDGRDDRALEAAAALLVKGFASDVFEPAICEGKEDFNRMSPEDRRFASAKAQHLYDELHRARMFNVRYSQEAVNVYAAVLGQRVPNRIELVEVDASSVSVREVEARRVPPPAVPATQAG